VFVSLAILKGWIVNVLVLARLPTFALSRAPPGVTRAWRGLGGGLPFTLALDDARRLGRVKELMSNPVPALPLNLSINK
jgi:hypothetical protein